MGAVRSPFLFGFEFERHLAAAIERTETSHLQAAQAAVAPLSGPLRKLKSRCGLSEVTLAPVLARS